MTASRLLLSAVVLIGFANPPRSRAQSAESPAFEVASVKPASPDALGVMMRFMPGGGLRIVNASLKDIISIAFDVDRRQITGGPDWINSERFDIVATSPQRSDDEKLIRQRIQTLLSERFHLSAHREDRELPVFNLVSAKSGHKLQPSNEDDGVSRNRGKVIGNGATTMILASVLTTILGRPVLDQTGLTERYKFQLEWTEESGPIEKGGIVSIPSDANPDSPGPSIFSAIQEQLGLKLESARGPVKFIVIDRVEKLRPPM
jgi:uncharacterized protein (TIGR03435 family)